MMSYSDSPPQKKMQKDIWFGPVSEKGWVSRWSFCVRNVCLHMCVCVLVFIHLQVGFSGPLGKLEGI